MSHSHEDVGNVCVIDFTETTKESSGTSRKKKLKFFSSRRLEMIVIE